MKIIEAMKKIKELQRKSEDLRGKVHKYCSDQDYETPLYGKDQAKQISEWIQAHSDIAKEILRLRIDIQKVNLKTDVSIEIGSKTVTKTIAEWIHRRRDLASLERSMWSGIGDRGLKEGTYKSSAGDDIDLKIRRYYDPVERDRKEEEYRSEPHEIDSTLEVVNAITDV